MKKHCYLFIYGFAGALVHKGQYPSVAEATKHVADGFGFSYLILDDNKQIIKKGFKK